MRFWEVRQSVQEFTRGEQDLESRTFLPCWGLFYMSVHLHAFHNFCFYQQWFLCSQKMSNKIQYKAKIITKMLGWNLGTWGQQLACVINLSEPWWCLLAFLCCRPETVPWSHVARAFWPWDPGTFSHRLSLMNSSSHRLLVVIIVACVIILSPFIEPGLSLFLKLIYI